MAVTWGTFKDRIARRAHKVLTRTLDAADVTHWGKAGIEYVENEDAWEYLRIAPTMTMVEGQYEYDWEDSWERFDENSMRYGNNENRLIYLRRPENIDQWLPANWRTSTETSNYGTPRYFVDFGRKFWIAPKPSATFVANTPTMYFYGWTSDLQRLEDGDDADATTLLLPRRGLEFFVNAALMVGLQQEDDPDWRAFENTTEKGLQKFRSFNPNVNADGDIPLPDFSHQMRF